MFIVPLFLAGLSFAVKSPEALAKSSLAQPYETPIESADLLFNSRYIIGFCASVFQAAPGVSSLDQIEVNPLTTASFLEKLPDITYVNDFKGNVVQTVLGSPLFSTWDVSSQYWAQLLISETDGSLDLRVNDPITLASSTITLCPQFLSTGVIPTYFSFAGQINADLTIDATVAIKASDSSVTLVAIQGSQVTYSRLLEDVYGTTILVLNNYVVFYQTKTCLFIYDSKTLDWTDTLTVPGDYAYDYLVGYSFGRYSQDFTQTKDFFVIRQASAPIVTAYGFTQANRDLVALQSADFSKFIDATTWFQMAYYINEDYEVAINTYFYGIITIVALSADGTHYVTYRYGNLEPNTGNNFFGPVEVVTESALSCNPEQVTLSSQGTSLYVLTVLPDASDKLVLSTEYFRLNPTDGFLLQIDA